VLKALKDSELLAKNSGQNALKRKAIT